MPNAADPLPDLDYWRQRRQVGLTQSNLLPRAAELGAGINWLIISALLIMGELFEDLTPFKGISFPVMGFAGLASPPAPRRVTNPNDLYHELDDILRRTIRLIPSELPVVMGLSGGADTRYILLAHLAEGRPPPRLVTARHFINPLSEQDIAAAQLLAERLGLPLQVVEQPGDRFRVEWEKNLRIGLQGIRHSWGLALAKAVRGFPVLYDGMSGGIIFRPTLTMNYVLKQSGGKRLSFPAMRKHFLDYRLARSGDPLEAWAPAHLISPAVMQELRDRLFTCFSRYEGFPNPVTAYLEDQQSRREIPPFTFGMMPNAAVVCPWNAPEMVRLGISLPWDSLLPERDLRAEAIARCYPEFADVPYERQLTNLPRTWQPDARSEAHSWTRVRAALAPHLSQTGLDYLDKTHTKLDIIQRATLLAQAYHWDEHGALPSAAEFFGAPEA